MDYPDSMVRELIQGDDRSKWIAHSNHNVKCFTQDEIVRFTNNYETMLGRGAFGEVYEGVLEDKSVVAVKRFINNVKENFAKELTVHREINHKNVVRLVGYCLEENAVMMVTEYIPKGNLSDVLHGDNAPISLDTRLRIAIECADALGYMHSQMYTQVIHGDIKPANILLDEGLGAKISDFGISRLVNTENTNTLYTVHIIGSIGYMDPLFARTGRLIAKNDVYSFGVVLLELITRKKPREMFDAENFTKALAEGMRSVREMFDSGIAIPSNMKTMEQIAQLAGKCLRMELNKRPEMLKVAEHLRRLRKALHQRQERRALFSWGKKNKLPPTDTLQEGSRSSHYVGIAGPAKMTTSEESSSGTKNVGTFIVGSTMTCPLLFNLDSLLKASAEVLGKGTVGTSYKATLESGAQLVVKRLREVNLPKEEFELRVAVIGAIQNRHIAPLQWYYYSKDEKMLVYNIFPMGSLAHALHGDPVFPAPLGWEQRAAIALAAARGVAYIHSAGPSSCHGNIKSSNIMLTGTHDACVSEHGLTMLCLPGPVSGYRAPEVTDDERFSQKADVYSFGVLLLELASRQAPVKNTQLEEGVDLVQWARSVIRGDWTSEVLDVGLLARTDGEDEHMMGFLQLAIHCCSDDANLRPTMSDVVQRIEEMTT
uniref:Uncharacterized protein n=2 Tax=Avena sativa TaxID=4498 RepID=A0ACD5X1P3_AVESA